MTETITLAAPPSITGSMAMYRDVQVVEADRHAMVAIRTGGESYGFAARNPLVPLTVDEFERAALDYPIVLVGPDRAAFAVMGLTADRNLFIGADGAFRSGAYIPAYLRRYPFVFARTQDGDHRLLCLDMASERVAETGTDGAEPIFENKEPTDLTRQALSFCEAFEAAEMRTRDFADRLSDAALLQPREARWTPGGEGEAELLVAYQAPTPEGVTALSDDQLAGFRRDGTLGPLFAMLLSNANWDRLAAIRGEAER